MMFDFNNKKNRKIVSSIIVILLVLAMVAPMVLSALTYQGVQELVRGEIMKKWIWTAGLAALFLGFMPVS